MNPEGFQKLGRLLLTLICFAAYLFLFIAEVVKNRQIAIALFFQRKFLFIQIDLAVYRGGIKFSSIIFLHIGGDQPDFKGCAHGPKSLLIPEFLQPDCIITRDIADAADVADFIRRE